MSAGFRVRGRKPRWWLDFAACRLHVRKCRHPLTTYEYSRIRKHPNGRGQTYTRCFACLRVLWRAWDSFPYGRRGLSRLVGQWRYRRFCRRQLARRRRHGR